jgi:hypothetical protein
MDDIGSKHSPTGGNDMVSTAKDLLAMLGVIFVIVIIGSAVSARRKKGKVAVFSG